MRMCDLRCGAMLLLLLAVPVTAASATDEQAIEDLVRRSYVEGILVQRDATAARAGFHPSFVLHVLHEGQVIQAPFEMWLERMGLDGTSNEKSVTCDFLSIDITGDTAMAKLEIREDDVLLYTDYFGLYRVEGEWKIVNKVFQGH